MIINKRPSRLGNTLKSKNNNQPVFQQISELPIENNASQILQEKVSPKKGHQRDKFEGTKDPKTNLRSGEGIYHYENSYFEFSGSYKNGRKNGEGELRLGNGTVIKGTFIDDELIGEATIMYADGSTYKGNLEYGQKSGYGIFKSKFESYEGEYKDNKKQGKGVYKNSREKIEGQFHKDKPHGQAIKTSYNYQYQGQFQNGLKEGKGTQKSEWLGNEFKYTGNYQNDKFDGQGIYVNKSFGSYTYEGEFQKGVPKLYPNQLKISYALQPIQKDPSQEKPQPSKQSYSLCTSNSVLQYEIQAQTELWLCIQACYQGPQELDPIQPTPEDIEKMIKDWQNENKKNKNPPPMPDFNQPRMIKPELVLIDQESNRPIIVKLCKTEQVDGNEIEVELKVDYRQAISQKRKENQETRIQLAKKAEQEGAKKGGKGPAKGGELELKVNVFNENPNEKEKQLTIYSQKGIGYVQRYELPDDFPIGNYYLKIYSSFEQFGQIKTSKVPLNVKPKNAGKKK